MRNALYFLAILSYQVSLAQSPLEFVQYQHTDILSPELTKERSLVLISTDTKTKEWKEISTYVHKSFRLMGIDAVNYIHYLDYQANPTVRQTFNRYFDQRAIRYKIIIEKRLTDYRIQIIDRNIDEKISWYSEGENVRMLIRNLAVTLKRTDHINQNFLISLQPEYISHLPMFEGTRFPNYPDRIKRLRMAIFEIPLITEDSLLTPEQLKEIRAMNKEIESKNQWIRQLADAYPYKLDVVKMQTEKELYRQGYQYVMYYLYSSAESIRKILDYESTDKKEYISHLTLVDGQRTLKTYPAEAKVYKWYIKQTAVSDLHLGRYWDAHADFEESLQYVINRIVSILK